MAFESYPFNGIKIYKQTKLLLDGTIQNELHSYLETRGHILFPLPRTLFLSFYIGKSLFLTHLSNLFYTFPRWRKFYIYIFPPRS